jgi:hypothetical protein
MFESVNTRNPTRKLTPEQVTEIRNRYVPRIILQKNLASEYGVTQKVINLILQRHTYKEIK